jgi:hypothetical protein
MSAKRPTPADEAAIAGACARWACRRRRWRRISQASVQLGGWAQVGATTCGRRSLRAARMRRCRPPDHPAALGGGAVRPVRDEIAERWAEVRARIPRRSAHRRRSRRRRDPAGGRRARRAARPGRGLRRRLPLRSSRATRARRCRPRSASTCGPRCSAGRWNRSIRRSRRSASPASSASPPSIKGFASDVAEHRLPVLLNPGVHSVSGGDDPRGRSEARFQPAGQARLGPVQARGRVLLRLRRGDRGRSMSGKLVRDALGLPPKTKPPNEPAPRLDPALDSTASLTRRRRCCGPCR